MAKEGSPSSLIAKLYKLSCQEWTDLCRAVLALGHARRQLPHLKAAEIQQDPSSRTAPPSGLALPTNTATLIARVTWAIPRAAKMVPWRSDCLVQTKAGQNWLKRQGVPSTIRLGSRKLPGGKMDAHAWLVCEGEVVTGGDISTFVPFR